MPTILAYAMQVLQVLPVLITAGQNVTAFIKQANDALYKMQAEGRDPSAAEWDALNAQIDQLRAILHGNGVDINKP